MEVLLSAAFWDIPQVGVLSLSCLKEEWHESKKVPGIRFGLNVADNQTDFHKFLKTAMGKV